MKIFWSWGLALLLAAPAWAAGLSVQELGVQDLRLQPDAAWQRGAPEQEHGDDALSLSWPVPGGASLQVLVPRSPPRIKGDAETFYRNLRRNWLAQYGKAAAIDWAEFQPGGVRWLSCRRPGHAGKGVVFHLVTVHAGRAYTVLLFTPPGTEALPSAAHALMAGAGFQAMPMRWRRIEALALLPRGEALDALAQAEADALGDQGMLTGYVLEAEGMPETGQLGLSWALDGFRWRKRYGRDERLPFELRGRLVAEAPPALEGAPVRLGLQVAPGEIPLAARLSLHDYCGPRGPWEEAMAALRRGARGPLARLALDHPCTGQAGKGKAAELATLEAGAGEALERVIPLPAPAAQAGNGPRWLEVELLPGAGSLGEGLLGRLALIFVYEPEEARR